MKRLIELHGGTVEAFDHHLVKPIDLRQLEELLAAGPAGALPHAAGL